MPTQPKAARPGPGDLQPELVPLSRVKLDPRNARLHPTVNLSAIERSLARFGQRKPIVLSKNRTVVAGNGTTEAARNLGWTEIWATTFPGTPAEARAFAIADNHTSDLSEWDNVQLLSDLQALDTSLLLAAGYTAEDVADLAALVDGPDLDGSNTSPSSGALATRFGVPPFTVLDARSGPWQARKRAWLALGIQSEVGRSDKLMGGLGVATKMQAKLNPNADGTARNVSATAAVSVFDPVLCELVYRWYSAEGHHVLDPWAGGSVRGIVASHLGRSYTGIELRAEQVAANRAQAGLAGDGTVTWVEGESTSQLMDLEAESFDMVIGCPPYYNLEKYSEDPRDLSTMTPAQFDTAMHANVAAAAAALKPDAFAVFIVGSVRTPGGRLLDMRALMSSAASKAGLVLYNDAVLLTPIGSLPVRAGKAFAASRVLGRAHQEVLVYLKGDRKRATAGLGDVDLEQQLGDAAALVQPDPTL